MTPELQERLRFELKTIREMGFADYFLIVWDFIRFAKTNGIGVGPGRGSAAGSIVAYALEITDIDPIKYDLLFERFLNPGARRCRTSTSTSPCTAATRSSTTWPRSTAATRWRRSSPSGR